MQYVKYDFVPISIMVVIDQLIKCFIRISFNVEFDIWGDILRFRPIHNTKLSWGGHYIEILSNKGVLIFINSLVLLVFITGYAFYKSKRKVISPAVYCIMLFSIAGCVCSLIDKLFWGGSLDFIQIPNLFTFDLKDCYLSITVILFAIVGLKHHKEISIREYLKFCFLKKQKKL